MTLLRENYTPDKKIITAITERYADGKFGIVNELAAAQVSIPDEKYTVFNVAELMNKIGREFAEKKPVIKSDLDDFTSMTETGLEQLNKEPARAAEKNMGYCRVSVTDGFLKRVQFLAQRMKLFKILAYAHAEGRRFGVLKDCYDNYGNAEQHITGLFNTNKEMAKKIIEELEIEVGNAREHSGGGR